MIEGGKLTNQALPLLKGKLRLIANYETVNIKKTRVSNIAQLTFNQLSLKKKLTLIHL